MRQILSSITRPNVSNYLTTDTAWTGRACGRTFRDGEGRFFHRNLAASHSERGGNRGGRKPALANGANAQPSGWRL